MDQSKTIQIIKDIATGMGLDVNLALAIAFVETGLDPTKVRFEPKWKYFVNTAKYAMALGITIETETILQGISWGPLQILGSNCRALGYQGILTLLVQPQLGVLYACRQLKALTQKYSDEADVISSYNQGSPIKDGDRYRNYDYVTKVQDRLSYLRRG